MRTWFPLTNWLCCVRVGLLSYQTMLAQLQSVSAQQPTSMSALREAELLREATLLSVGLEPTSLLPGAGLADNQFVYTRLPSLYSEHPARLHDIGAHTSVLVPSC